MTPLLVGVDVGTTNVKAVVYKPDGTAVAVAVVPTPTHYPRPSWAFYRPDELWAQTTSALRDALAKVDDPRRVAGIAITSMGEAGVPLDTAGKPTFDAIAWFDTRTEPQVAWLEREIGRDFLFATTGLSLQPIWSLCKLLWLRENQPDAFGRTVRWLNIADYVAYRLCGAQATDLSLASRTMALDLAGLRWSEDLLAAVGLPRDLLAPLAPSGTRLAGVTAESARETGLLAHTPVSAGGHDHVCGAFAAGVTEPGAVLNSLGTAEALFVALERPLTDAAMGDQGYSQGAHVVPGRYYAFGGQYTVGASVDWLRGILGADADYATLLAEAGATPPGSLGVCFLPHLRLAGPPVDDPRSRGAFVGLSTDATRGTLVRATLEGLAFESRSSLEPLLAHAGVAMPSEIVAIGGVTRNTLLMRIKATTLDRPFTIADVEEATTLGAAILGGIGAGVYPDVPTALSGLRYPRTPTLPMAEDVVSYDALYRDVYRRIYPALRPVHHAVHASQSGS